MYNENEFDHTDSLIGEGTKEVIVAETQTNLSLLKDELLVSNIGKIRNLKDFPSDGVMTEMEFREKYDTFLEKLGTSLDFGKTNGKALILGIIHQETNFARELKHPGGSSGVMQLTKWPFCDMKGETLQKGVFDIRKVEKFQKIFQELHIEELKNIKYGEEGTIKDTLPEDIWNKLEKISNKNTSPRDASQIIHELQQVEKGVRKDYYLHTLNMIIGSVYLKHIYETKGKNDVGKTAFYYNGNPALQKKYSENVVGYYKGENV